MRIKKSRNALRAAIERALLAVAASLFVVGAAQGQVTIDQSPLIVAEPLPPNILFIMDDSGSMGWQHMPGTTANWTNGPASGLPHQSMNNDIRLRASNINTQWYDPQKHYLPWKNHDGSSWGNINPESAPYDPSGAVTIGTHNLRQTAYPSLPSDADRDSTSVTSSTGIAFRFQGFYVHQSGDVTMNSNYKRFDFRWDSGSSRWEGRLCNWDTWGTETNLNNCDYYVGNDTMGPFGNTMAQEVQNYANWFSYYRLRMSMAKAAASQTFADLGEDHRVGYNTIWNRLNYRIPVGTDNGLFKGMNKEGWFSELFKTIANNATPLRQSLDSAGQYFSETDASGPYGPEATSDQFSCRQNFTIMTTDGYWNSNAASSTAVRADNDSTNGTTITGPNGATYTFTAARPYLDNRSDTLADVAMYYWKNNLRTDLKNDVPTSASNPAFWQHMVTFGISLGARGVLNPQTDLPSLIDGSLLWPAPGNDSTANIDDLWHAAVNSRGEFIVASDADALRLGLKNALGVIGDRLGSGTSLAANSTKLETGTMTFQAQYWSGAWRGELNAFAVDPVTGALAATPTWSASAALPAWDSRSIHFNDPTVSADSALKSFQYANLTTAQQAALGNSADLVDYLRGLQSKEQSQGGSFRTRTSLLGDIVNSQPVFVGTPNVRLYANSSFTGADTYAAFAAAQASRTPAVYVGGNDGMLHGFNANTGVELFAFIPNSVIMNGLATLADPAYDHQYFVDGELTVADVHDTVSGSWKTILVGTLGRGGRSVFALDITNPGSVKFLWEKSALEIGAIGNTIGRPVIAQVANGKWRVLLGNGPNGAGDAAQLIMIEAIGGAVQTGESQAINTGASGSNGLSAIRAWDSNADGFTDTVYAGDLQGNLWRFTGLPTAPSSSKLFVATDKFGMPQPITAAPLAGKNPDTNEMWVFFGTGQYLNQADLIDPQIQTWYGLKETGGTVLRSNLVERTILAEGEINGFGARVIEEGSQSELLSKDGWFIDLLSPANGAEGERMIVPNQFRGRVLVGTTRIPDANDPCNPSGRGFVMAIDPFSGARLGRTFFDITLDGLFNDDDKLLVNGVLTIVSGIGFSASPNNPIFIDNVMQVGLEDGSTKSMATQGTSADAVRQSWRELIGN